MKKLTFFAAVCLCGFLSACEKAPDVAEGYSYCQNAAEIMDRNSAELQEPYDWNRMMLASSRLVYIENNCGSRVTEPREKLCADLDGAIAVFAANPAVPQGANRDNALNIANSVFTDSGCGSSQP